MWDFDPPAIWPVILGFGLAVEVEADLPGDIFSNDWVKNGPLCIKSPTFPNAQFGDEVAIFPGALVHDFDFIISLDQDFRYYWSSKTPPKGGE
jgi:hypothetical protein